MDGIEPDKMMIMEILSTQVSKWIRFRICKRVL
jgi:hypothetical protein